MSLPSGSAVEPTGYPHEVPEPYALSNALKAAEQSYIAAYDEARTVLGRRLLPGDPSPCCAGELLVDFGAELFCPACGHTTPHLTAVAA